MQIPASSTTRAAGVRTGSSALPISRWQAAYATVVVFACVLTFVVISWGGWVRATGAGLACPDWPLCNGQVVPPMDELVLIEWGHRFIAGVLGFAIFFTTFGAWRWHRRDRAITVPATLATVFVIIQIILGALTVTEDLSPQYVSAHLGTSMLVFASLIVTAAGVNNWPRTAAPASLRIFPLLALFGAFTTYALMLTGTYVVGSGAGGACRSWPLCDGLPGGGDLVQVHMFHRVAVLFVGGVVGYLGWAAYKLRKTAPLLWRVARISGAIYLAQALVGAGNIWFGVVPPVQVAHITTAAAMWGSMVLLATLAWRMRGGEFGVANADGGLTQSSGMVSTGAPPVRGRAQRRQSAATRASVNSTPGVWDTARAYIALTKPRIIELLLVTTVPAMVLAEQGMPSLWLIAVAVIGGTLCAGGANAINCYVDRDIDQIMRRTQKRPLPRGVITPAKALIFAIGLEVAGFLLLAVFANLLAAVLALSATLFYVFIYTLWLKRSSAQNIVIGGAAGAVPPLVGWAAVTGSLDWPAIVMFAVIFFWTPPHFWALALKYKDDYAAAGVPMAPSVWGERRTIREIVLYTVVTALTALLLVPAGAGGVVYIATALLLGVAFLYYALRLRRLATTAAAMRLFTFSIAYLFLLFAAMVVDQASRSAGL